MPGHKFAIIDPAAGISGDMLLAALIDAGAPSDWLAGLPARIGLPDVSVTIEPTVRCGIRALSVKVHAADGSVEGPGQPHVHEGTAQHGPHRHVASLVAQIERARLSDRTRELAVRTLRLLAEAEGRVHGVAPERVALHEVGAADALVDIVGGIEGFEQLGIDQVYTLPVALGSGWVSAAHGRLPVPAPATAILLEGLEVVSGGPVTGEATTPTGAALLRVLSHGAPPARWRPLRSAWGAGTRNPPGYPNALRLIVAETAAEAGSVVLLATDVDDLSPEYLEPLREELSAAGALDVQMWSTQMKKGRIGFRIEAIAPADRTDAVAEAFFRHSTTTGLRLLRAERLTLPRREWTLATSGGASIRVKTVETPDGPRAKPEYEDVIAEARRTGRPAHDLARELHEIAAKEPE